MPNRAGPPPVQNRSLTVQQSRMGEVITLIDARQDQFMALLGRENVERWKTVALHALAGNDKVLRDCTPLSIVEAIRESAALGLSPTGLLGEGWILPYKDQAKFMPGYRGYLKLLRNSGQIRIADAQLVYLNDDFRVQLGTDPSIHHVPKLYGEKDDAGEYAEERGDYRGAYAWVRLTSGETMIEWMSFDDLMAIKKKSPSGNRGEGPWISDPGEMMRKTPIRRLVKRLPLESMPLVARAAVLDEEGDVIEGEAVEVQPAARTRATAAAYAVGRGATDEDSGAQGTAETADETAQLVADAAAGDPGEQGEAEMLCRAVSPYDAVMECMLFKGHGVNHKGSDKSTWQ